MYDDSLDVSLSGEHIGILVPTRKGARFQFDEKICETYLGQPLLSVALPVKNRAYSEGRTNAWFRGLLPEGQRLDKVCREIGCDTADYMNILSIIGWECAGAVSIAKPNTNNVPPAQTKMLNITQLADRLIGLVSSSTGSSPITRVSLGGFQDKLVVVATDIAITDGYVSNGNYSLPNAATISTHIIKPQPQGRHAHLIEAEAWAMKSASEAARCAHTALLKEKGAPLSLIVERFDRKSTSGVLERIHQEDCGQAMGLEPAQKYAAADEEKGDDPSYRKIANLLTVYAENPEEEISELLRQMVVNLVLGNLDAHAKNYSFLYEKPCLPTMSPLYDVTPVHDIEPEAKYLSMRINGKILAGTPTRADVVTESVSWGMAPNRASTIIDDTLDKLTTGIKLANKLYPEAGKRHAKGAMARTEALRQ